MFLTVFGDIDADATSRAGLSPPDERHPEDTCAFCGLPRSEHGVRFIHRFTGPGRSFGRLSSPAAGRADVGPASCAKPATSTQAVDAESACALPPHPAGRQTYAEPAPTAA